MSFPNGYQHAHHSHSNTSTGLLPLTTGQHDTLYPALSSKVRPIHWAASSCIIHHKGGDCHVCENVRTTSVHYVTTSWKLESKTSQKQWQPKKWYSLNYKSCQIFHHDPGVVKTSTVLFLCNTCIYH